MRSVFIVFGSIAIVNEPLELGVCSLVWNHRKRNLEMATVLNFEVISEKHVLKLGT